MNGFDIPTDQINRLTVEWSDKDGDYLYTLAKLNEFSNGERQRATSCSGDKAWAERIAEHYGIEIPEAQDD